MALACMLGLAGCDKLFGLERLEPASDAPVESDAPVDASRCDGRFVNICPTHVESSLELVDDMTLDTTASSCELIAQGENQPPVCVFAAEVIHIGAARVSVTGPLPVVLFATETFTLDAGGTLDVSSTATRTGAGANWGMTAVDGANQGGIMPGGAGGGAGGSFGGRGGSGGASDGNAVSVAVLPIDPTQLSFVRGGAAGARGGAAMNTPTIHAAGGSSGGAIYVIAGKSITIAGHVLANGAGGSGGRGVMITQHAAGGGGGSGGLVVLDAPTIALAPTTVILAHGGGGGGGANGASSGNDGQSPDSATPEHQASGGQGAGGAGAGGDASGGAAPNGDDGGAYDGTSGGGAGGGGGGAGICMLFGAATVQGSVYPPPFIFP